MGLLSQLLNKSGILDRADDGLHAKRLEDLCLLLRANEDGDFEGVLLGVVDETSEHGAAHVAFIVEQVSQ